MDEFIEKTIDKVEEKIKVTSAEIIVTGTKDKSYFEIRYKEVGKEDYSIGYSSYDLNNVFDWKEECFEIVNELAEESKDINIITNFLQYVRDNADNYDSDNGWSLSDLIDLSIKFCDEEERNGGWIPCEKELPKEAGCYLVSSNAMVFVAYWFNNTWWGIEKRCRWKNIIAWQFLPAPYNPKGE